MYIDAEICLSYTAKENVKALKWIIHLMLFIYSTE